MVCARAGAAGIALAARKVPGAEIIMDSKLIGYRFEDSNGAAWAFTDNKIEAYGLKSNLSIQKRGADSKSKQKKENKKGKKEGA